MADREVYYSLSPGSRSKRDLESDETTPVTKRVRLDTDNSASTEDLGQSVVYFHGFTNQ